MKDTKYNGWTNWETWKINLEIIGGMDTEDLGIENFTLENSYEAGEIIREYVEELIAMEYNYDGFVGGIIRGFLSEVNWTELASNIIEQYKTEV